MRYTKACALLMFLMACGANERAEKAAALSATAPPPVAAAESTGAMHISPAAASEVTDEKIGLPKYPGSVEAENMRFKLGTGLSESFTVTYRSNDSPTQVAEFYRAEGAKVGTLEESISIGDQLKTVAIKRADGSRSTVQAGADGKGTTVITIYRSVPVK